MSNGFVETIVGVLLKDNFLLTLEKLLRENNKYFKKNKQWVFLVVLANTTKKSMYTFKEFFFVRILLFQLIKCFCIVTEDNCDRIVRSGLMQYALDMFDIKSNSAKKADPKILSSALDTLVHISNSSKLITQHTAKFELVVHPLINVVNINRRLLFIC